MSCYVLLCCYVVVVDQRQAKAYQIATIEIKHGFFVIEFAWIHVVVSDPNNFLRNSKKGSSLQEQYSSLGERVSDNLGVCMQWNCRAFHRARGNTVEEIAANYPLQQSL